MLLDNSQKLKRTSRLFSFLCVLAALAIIGTITENIPIASAAASGDEVWNRYEDSSTAFYDLKEALREHAGDLAATAFEIVAWGNGDAGGDLVIDELRSIYSIGSMALWDGSTLISRAKPFYESIKVVGAAFIVLYFIMSIIQTVQESHFTPEMFYKKFVMLVVVIVIIGNGDRILDALLDFGDDMIEALVTETETAATFSTHTRTAFVELYDSAGESWVIGFVYALGSIIGSIFPFLVNEIVVVVLYFAAFSRFIELFIRYAYAPIGISTIMLDGTRSAGFRYIKKFMSVCLAGAIAIMAMYVVRLNDKAGDVDQTIFRLIIRITGAGLALKAQSLADDIIGVH